MPFGVHQRQPKKKKPSAKSLKRYERAAAAAEKKVVAAEAVSAEAKEGALGADAIDAASQEALWARDRAAKASAKLAAVSAPSERHAARCRLGHEARINGTVKPVDPSSADLEALGEASRPRPRRTRPLPRRPRRPRLMARRVGLLRIRATTRPRRPTGAR